MNGQPVLGKEGAWGACSDLRDSRRPLSKAKTNVKLWGIDRDSYRRILMVRPASGCSPLSRLCISGIRQCHRGKMGMLVTIECLTLALPVTPFATEIS